MRPRPRGRMRPRAGPRMRGPVPYSGVVYAPVIPPSTRNVVAFT